MKIIFRTILSFAVVLATAGFAASFISTQALTWYATINKPFFAPPGSVLLPIWVVFYILLALALARVWNLRESEQRHRWFFVFCIQLLLNLTWSLLFFQFHSLTLAMFDAIILWFAVVILTANSSEFDEMDFWILIPYLLWTTFTMILTIGVWWVD